MSYKLKFLPSALREWKKLSQPLQTRFKKKLSHILENPHRPASQLRGFTRVYKIKLHASGYRLVYEVDDNTVVVYVIAVGKRERGLVYAKAKQRSGK